MNGEADPLFSRPESCLSGVFVRWMMSTRYRFTMRVACHATLRIDPIPAQVRELEVTIRRRCQRSDA